MKSYKYHIGILLLIILLVLTVPYAWKLVQILFFPKHVKIWQQLSLFQWVAIGFVGYSFMRRFLNKNALWLETFTHELTHIVVAMLFLRKVHSFHAEEGSGVVYTSGQSNNMIAPMALAPYCLPIYTFLLLSVRCLMNFHGMWIFDIIIGVSLSFHVNCFIHQTGKYQTDINQYPLLFSYLFIYVARLFNSCIIVVAFFPHYNVFTSFWRLLNAQYDNIIYFWSVLF